MVDTKRGYFPEKKCNDCGAMECSFIHNGGLVPKNVVGQFCAECWMCRVADFEETGIAKPLGVSWRICPPEFKDVAVKVKTKNGGVYILGEPDKETGIRLIRKEGSDLPFTYAAIMLLRMCDHLFLAHDPDINGVPEIFHTSPIVAITANVP